MEGAIRKYTCGDLIAGGGEQVDDALHVVYALGEVRRLLEHVQLLEQLVHARGWSH